MKNDGSNDLYSDYDENEEKRMRPRRPTFLIPVLIVLLIAVIGVGALTVTGYLPPISKVISGLTEIFNGDGKNTDVSDISANTGDLSDTVKPDSMHAAFCNTFEQAEIEEACQYATLNSLNCITLPYCYDGKCIADKNFLDTAVDTVHKKGLLICINIDCSEIPKGKSKSGYGYILKNLKKSISGSGIDAAVISNCGETSASLPYAEYVRSGCGGGYDKFAVKYVTNKVTDIRNAVKSACPTVYLGLLCEPVWASSATNANGVAVNGAVTEDLINNHCDTCSFAQNGLFDFILVDGKQSTVDSAVNFETVLSWWKNVTADKADLYPLLRSSYVGQPVAGWSSPDQLARQMTVIENLQLNGYMFDSFSALKNDTTGSTDILFKYLSGAVSKDGILKDLTFTSPTNTTLTVTEDIITFTGASDPSFPLTCNSSTVERTQSGYFSVTFNLSRGVNTFSFSHKGKTVQYKVTYRYVILKSISPASAVKINGGSTYAVYAVARTGSTVTASFNGTTIALNRVMSDRIDGPDDDDSFCGYSGVFTMPVNYSSNKSYSAITFKATYNGQSETGSSGKITVMKTQKPAVVDNTVYPSDSGYINVGGGLIGEVVNFQGETFDGDKVDDASQPYNNYLPKGTIDYISPNKVYLGSTEYVLMRCGKRLYTTSKGVKVINAYEGILPAANNVSVAATNESTRYTTLTLNVDWKAPFKFQLKNQSYNTDRTIGNVTFSYVAIDFCYAGNFTGNIDLDPNNPIFSGYEIRKNQFDYTLILHLRKAAKFYGWYASYNSNGQLVFKFLKPAKISGNSLAGTRICIDPGHGGNDGGSPGKPYSEADLNLILANKVKTRLEAMGATVIMTRTSNTSMTSDERMKKLINAEPDFMLSIHRNAASSSNPNGFGAYYFNAFSKPAAQIVFNDTKAAGLYANSPWTALKFHYFYMCRCTVCPTVLTENGFMTNSNEYQNLVNDAYNNRCADALAQGVLNYFKSIQ